MSFIAKYHWGSALWSYIHTITIIDNIDPVSVIRLSNECIEKLRALEYVIPCHKCAEYYKKRLELLDSIELISMNLFKWSWELHNSVNLKLSKPEITYSDAITYWSK